MVAGIGLWVRMAGAATEEQPVSKTAPATASLNHRRMPPSTPPELR
jgi:hypothetical protein